MIRFPISTIYFRRLSEFVYLYERLLPIGLTVGAILTSIGLAYVLVDISLAFAIVGMLAIPAGILLVTRPDIGLLLVVFVIPLEDFNQLGGLSVLKLLSVVVFGGVIIHFFIFRRRDSLVGSPQNWLISLFLFAVILSNLVTIDPERTLDNTFKLIRILTLYLFVINVIRSERDLKYLLWVFLISGFFSAAYGLFDPEQMGNGGRFTGTMDDPNVFAASMAARLPLILSLMKIEKSHLKRVLLLVMLGVMIYGITLTGSRGGLLATGLALVLFIILQKNKIIWLVLAGVIVLAGLTIMPLEMKKRVGLVETSVDENLGNDTTRRKSYQIYGLQLWQQHPILGIGFGGFNEAYTRSAEYRFLQTTQKRRAAHNTYLEILVGTGLVGIIPFISLLILSLFTSWKYAGYQDRYPYLGNIAIGLFAGQGAFFLGILFLSREFDKTLWLFIALVVVVYKLINITQDQRLPLAVKR